MPGAASIVTPTVQVPSLTSMSWIVKVCHSFHFVSWMSAVCFAPPVVAKSWYFDWPPPPCVETASVYLPSLSPVNVWLTLNWNALSLQ